MFCNLDLLPAFEGLDEEYIELLKPLFEASSYPAGAVVLRQGAPADYFYLVLDGMVEVSFKPEDAPPITISHVEKGGWFGWSAVLGRRKYTSSATAIETLGTIRIHGNALRELCAERPEAAKIILEHLADNVSSRWKDAHKQVKSLLAKGMKNKQE